MPHEIFASACAIAHAPKKRRAAELPGFVSNVYPMQNAPSRAKSAIPKPSDARAEPRLAIAPQVKNATRKINASPSAKASLAPPINAVIPTTGSAKPPVVCRSKVAPKAAIAATKTEPVRPVEAARSAILAKKPPIVAMVTHATTLAVDPNSAQENVP
jgi:hypothetical protein